MPARRPVQGLIALFAAMAVTAMLRAQTSLPITLTGFSGDNILGAGESEPSGTNTTDNNYIYYGVGASDNGATLNHGLPSNGELISQSNSNVEFQLAPYSGNNILQGGGTLTLSTPGSFQSLSFLATSILSSSFSVTLNFSNSTSVTTLVYSVPDWTGTGGSGTSRYRISGWCTRTVLEPITEI